MRIPDTFIFIDRKSTRATPQAGEWVAITTGKSFKGVRLDLSAPLQRVVGSTKDAPVYMQVHISSQTIKLTQCRESDKGARRVGASGYISVPELGDKLELPERIRYICKAEIVRNKGALELWATFPQELRDHIDDLNGVAR